mgnify:CR=1
MILFIIMRSINSINLLIFSWEIQILSEFFDTSLSIAVPVIRKVNRNGYFCTLPKNKKEL